LSEPGRDRYHAVLPEVATLDSPLPIATHFMDPPWKAPLNLEVELQKAPEEATISGMFLQPLVQEALARGYSLPSAQERYLPFKFYPVREHMRLLWETCSARFPELSSRQALRKLGRGAPRALLGSTLGKVVLGPAEGVHAVVRAMASAYALNVKPGGAVVLDEQETRLVVRLEQIHYFLDSHHVGTFEGVLRHAGVNGRVTLYAHAHSTADLLLEWDG
jgi:uncharacterized protein (TIGR02265 family)